MVRHYWQYNTQNYYYYYYYVIFLRGKAESWRVCACAHWQVKSLLVLREMHALPKTLLRTEALEMDSHSQWGGGKLRVARPPMGSVVERSMEDKHEGKMYTEQHVSRRVTQQGEDDGSSEGHEGASGVSCLSVCSSAKMDSKTDSKRF